jgi:hypothetical protein
MSSPESATPPPFPAPQVLIAQPRPESAEAHKLAMALEAKFERGELDALTPEALQALIAILCKFYGANIAAGTEFPALSDRMAATGTDVMLLCGALLRAAGLQVFELGMWQSWTGR